MPTKFLNFEKVQLIQYFIFLMSCAWYSPRNIHFQKKMNWIETNIEFFRMKITTLKGCDMMGDGTLVRRVKPYQFLTQEGIEPSTIRSLSKMIAFHCKHSPKEENA